MDDATSAPRRCSVCGDPLRRDNTIGICTSRRRPECRTAYANEKYKRDAHEAAGGAQPGAEQCEVCGKPLLRNNRTGVCSGRTSPECKQARNRKRNPTRPSRALPKSARTPCAVCGEPLRADNIIGVCRRTPECLEEITRRRRLLARVVDPGKRGSTNRKRRVPAIPAGTVFGRWVTLEETAKGATRVRCRCSCPDRTESDVPIGNLKRGMSKSCGCLKRENLGRPKGPQGIYLPAGFVTGRLVTLEDAPMSYTEVLVRCECGGDDVRKNAQRVKYGLVVSCGCKPKENLKTHGLSDHPLYHIWRGIVRRCTDPTDRAYKGYGAIGRSICKGYRYAPDGLLRYAADMGPRPSKDHSTDRPNNLGGYWCGRCPECVRNGWSLNVAWRTRIEQQNNLSCSPGAVAERMARAADAAEHGMLF